MLREKDEDLNLSQDVNTCDVSCKYHKRSGSIWRLDNKNRLCLEKDIEKIGRYRSGYFLFCINILLWKLEFIFITKKKQNPDHFFCCGLLQQGCVWKRKNCFLFFVFFAYFIKILTFSWNHMGLRPLLICKEI